MRQREALTYDEMATKSYRVSSANVKGEVEIGMIGSGTLHICQSLKYEPLLKQPSVYLK